MEYVEAYVLLLVYVDDILITSSNPQYIASLIQQMNNVFSLKDLGELHYFLRIEVKRTSSTMLLPQQKYITDLLKKARLDGARLFQLL